MAPGVLCHPAHDIGRPTVGANILQARETLFEKARHLSIGGGCLGRAQRANDGEMLLAVCRRYLARAREGGGNASLIHPSVIHGPAAAA